MVNACLAIKDVKVVMALENKIVLNAMIIFS